MKRSVSTLALVSLVSMVTGAALAGVWLGPWSPLWGPPILPGAHPALPVPHVPTPRLALAPKPVLVSYKALKRELQEGEVKALHNHAMVLAIYYREKHPKVALLALQLAFCKDLSTARTYFLMLSAVYTPPVRRPMQIQL